MPFQAALVHGGPGAAGELKPVAMELSRYAGILEPLQTADSIQGQVEELKDVIIKNTDNPVILIGFSWGAWLSFIFTSKYNNLVKQLVLVESGPFEEKYTQTIMNTRISRLNNVDRIKLNLFSSKLSSPESKNKNSILREFGALMSITDSFEPSKKDLNQNDIIFREDIYEKIWEEASGLRKSGTLLEYGKNIKCPVFAIHGDYDPHPAEGVIEPLNRILKDFQYIILAKCGHRPWTEIHAREKFYYILKEIINGNGEKIKT